MWIFTPFGFFSIVRKSGDERAGSLTVRARVRGDLEALRDSYLPGLGAIEEHLDRDYRFRATAPRAEVSAALAQLAEDMDYDDFKQSVAENQGDARAKLYGAVWWTLRALQTDPVFAAEDPLADSHGGVVVSGGRKVLLRAPSKGHGGYAWTFAKTEARPGETSHAAAIRAVREKTGYDAEIRIAIPGVFKGAATTARYYVMDAANPPAKPGWETSGLRWVDFDAARALIRETTNAEGRARDLAILDAAEQAMEKIPYRMHARVQPEDWPTLQDMPRQRDMLFPKLVYDAEEMLRIRRGFFPTVQEQKWFLCFTGTRLRMHRSWTGNLIYDVGFDIGPDGAGFVTEIVVNRDPEQYGETDGAHDTRMVEDIIRHHLLEPLEDPAIDGLTQAAIAAAQPNYLGSPEVVSPLVGGIFEAIARIITDKATVEELNAAVARLIAAFAGEDPTYTRMPNWHSATGLGKHARTYLVGDPALPEATDLRMALDAGLAALLSKVNEMLAAFFADPRATWQEHALVQLNAVHHFVTAVLLGTNTVTHGDRTLADFHWIPAQDASQTERQTILEVGTEGGSIRLVGIHAEGKWRLRMETDESGFSSLLDADDQFSVPERPWVKTWRAALRQLDLHPWAALYPLHVHAAFRNQIRSALVAREKKGADVSWPNWNDVLTR